MLMDATKQESSVASFAPCTAHISFNMSRTTLGLQALTGLILLSTSFLLGAVSLSMACFELLRVAHFPGFGSSSRIGLVWRSGPAS